MGGASPPTSKESFIQQTHNIKTTLFYRVSFYFVGGTVLNIVIATIRDGKTIKGYRVLFTDRLEVNDIPVEKLEAALTYMQLEGVTYDATYKCLVSITGLKITDLPVLDTTKTLIGKMGTFITHNIVDKSNNLIGYIVISVYGEVKRVTKDSISGIAKNTKPINYRVVLSGTEEVAEPVRGYSFLTEVTEQYNRTSYRSAKENKIVLDRGDMGIPKVPMYSLQKVVGSEFNKSASEKMLRAVAGLKEGFPYYWVMLQAIERKPCDDTVCQTMGVTEDRFYYNINFINTISVPELVFVLIHEIMHIAKRDVVRMGKRNPKLWNIATDLYINEMILTDFGLTPGVCTNVNGVEIQPVQWSFYFSSIGEVCDLSKDIPEAIYSRLSENSQPNGGSSDGNNSKSDKGNNSDGDGNSSEGNNSPSENSGNGQEGSSNSDEQGSSSVSYNGKELKGKTFDDLMSNTGMSSKDEINESERQAKQKVQDMKTRKELVESKTGQKLEKGSSSAELIQRIIEFGLQGSVDWKSVVKNIVLEKPKKKYTLASPNEAYMNLGVTLASRRNIGKPDKVKRIVVGIDVSGSVSNKVLSRFLSEIGSIYNYYDVDGELVYWNTSACDSGLFSKRTDLKKVDSNWSGGTDVKCLFDYLVGKRETITGKSCRFRAKDIKAVIILTDGSFDRNYKEYEGVFGRKTLWLIDGAPEFFIPCFGKVIGMKE